MRILVYFLMSVLMTTAFLACEKDDPEIPNEEELITTVNYILTPNSGGPTVVLSFQDLDGDGGDDPVITGGTLMVNESYNGQLELLNESEDPAENITREIEEEDEDHQFFISSTISDMSISYLDQDENGNPIGLRTLVMTGSQSSGTVKIILRHKPDKNAAGVSDGNISNAGGDTDIEVIIPVDVQ